MSAGGKQHLSSSEYRRSEGGREGLRNNNYLDSALIFSTMNVQSICR